jgi:hypothetical protein
MLRCCRLSSPATALLAAALSLLGCSPSLSPRPDIDRAAAELEKRSNFFPGWDDQWIKDMTWRSEQPLSMEQAVLTALKNNPQVREQL